MRKNFNVAVVGATGAVGIEMVTILEERNFPVKEIKFLASQRSAGKKIRFSGEDIPIEVLDSHSFEKVDMALFSAGGAVSQEFVPFACQAGAVVIDNTSVFRMDPEVPLVVPEVNPEDISLYKNKGIIANPNCSTIQMVLVLKPIHDIACIKRVVVSTYQSVSGAGREAINELIHQTKEILNGDSLISPTIFPHQIAFNCLPQIDIFLDSGYTKEEIKMINETKKILGDDSILVTATTVRVPVIRAHSESVNIETYKKVSADQVKELLSKAPGIKVADDPKALKYPQAIDAAFKDETFVGRIREDNSIDKGINLWIVSDNLRKGAALNAIQIGEILVKDYL